MGLKDNGGKALFARESLPPPRRERAVVLRERRFRTDSFESAIRNAISIGGDSDTIAAIAGGVAEAQWGVPDNLRAEALARLDTFQRETVEDFEKRFS